MLDLLFPVLGKALPIDHAYPLYSALSRLVPAFHEVAAAVRFAPITGTVDGSSRLRLTGRSRLRVRLAAEAIRTALQLAGQSVEVAGTPVRFGAPTVFPLRPASALAARMVTFKHGEELGPFLTTANMKLAELGVAGEPAVQVIESGPRAGEPRRRVVRIKGRSIIGYAVLVSGLTAEDSIRLQEHGLGGRKRLGCGFFLPVKEEE